MLRLGPANATPPAPGRCGLPHCFDGTSSTANRSDPAAASVGHRGGTGGLRCHRRADDRRADRRRKGQRATSQPYCGEAVKRDLQACRHQPRDRLNFDGGLLADIFLGRVTRWNDGRIAALNPGVALPADDIIVVHRSDGSGTTFIFTDFLSKVSPTWSRQVGRATSVNWPIGLGGKGNEGVTQQVKQSPGSIGYVELIYALSNGLPSAKLRNGDGALVQPTLKSVAAAAAGAELAPDTDFRVSITNAPGPDSYPISSFTWLLIRKEDPDTTRARTIHDFVAWMLEPAAQRMAADLHYAPLPVPGGGDRRTGAPERSFARDWRGGSRIQPVTQPLQIRDCSQ